jgi:transcriptional regulator with XRE-family HTH domain
MIKNDRQYRLTRAEYQRFDDALKRLEQAEVPSDVPALRRTLELNALQAQAEELHGQIEAYDALRSGAAQPESLHELAGLPKFLIQTRIAKQLTQKELAEKLDLKEQQIQRYEANDYSGASLERLKEIAGALNVSFEVPLDAEASVKNMVVGLKSLGFDDDFIRRRLVGPLSDASHRLLDIASDIGRIFGWSADNVMRGSFNLAAQPFAAASFKIPDGVNEPKLRAYTLYARFLALVALDATPHVQPKQQLPSSAIDLRALIEARGSGLTFTAAIETLWGCGLVVLPLADKGAFHGAFWKAGGRGVIVLKQTTRVSGRWLFDLLHEVAHAVETEGDVEANIVDSDEAALLQRHSDREASANDFAAAVLLRDRADELAQIAVAAAGGRIERLKGVVPNVAREHDVSIDALAFHLAYRLKAENNIDWWAAATNLSSKADDWSIARDHFIAGADFSVLGDIDRRLLIRALEE